MTNDTNSYSSSDGSRQTSRQSQRPQQGQRQSQVQQNQSLRFQQGGGQGQASQQAQGQRSQRQASQRQGQVQPSNSQRSSQAQGQRPQQAQRQSQAQQAQGQRQAQQAQGQRSQRQTSQQAQLQRSQRGQAQPVQARRPQQKQAQDCDDYRYYQQNQEPEPKKKSKGKVILIVAIVVVVLAAAAFGAKALFSNPNGALQGTLVSVTIPDGSSADEFANILKEEDVISNKAQFIRKVKAAGAATSLKPGTYTLAIGMDLDELVATLVQGPIVQMEGNKVTIPEGLKATEVAERVEEATGISADDFMERVNSASDYVEDYPFVADAFNNSLEGFLYPKTYTIPEDEDADYVVRAMLDQFETETADLDLSYPESKGLSFYDVIIMASVVEKEVGPGEYAARAASVFYNRLEIGMQLQSDITMLYSVDWDESQFDRYLDTPWNTYVVEGLPYGPICSPCIDTIEAVCHPEETNYLYFYSVISTGETLFSETQDEHDAIVDKYEFGA